MSILKMEGGQEQISGGKTEVTVSAPNVTPTSIVLVTQAPNGIEEFRQLRVASITEGKSFVVKASAGENKISFSWLVIN